jgi:two-component system, NtrC family, sensor kinase
MTIRLRLVAIIVLVALVPLSVSAWRTLGVHRRALDARVRALQVRTGEQAAAAAAHAFDDEVANIERLSRTVPWRELSAAERDPAPWLIYRQVEDVAAVVLLDGTGRPIGPGAALTDERTVGDLAAHPRWSAAAGEVLLGAVGGTPAPIGAAIIVPGLTRPIVPLAIAIDDGGSVRTIVIALALDATCASVAATRTAALDATLVDAGGRVLCGAGIALAPAPARAGHERTRAPTSHGWMVLIDQDVDAIRAPSRQIRTQTLSWLAIGFLAALLAGFFLARRIVGPVEALARGAAELGGGNVAYRLPVSARGDELARLSVAFNRMGDEIQRRDADLQAWNERLQQLVDARTRELGEAQDQLLRSQRISAVGSLGAGFAHEINNPLTGLLGMTQVLLERALREPARAGDARLLESMEKDALRIGEVVSTLRRFTDDFGTEGGLVAIDLDRIVDDTIALIERRVSGRAVALVRTQVRALPPVLGDAEELQQALLHLIENALQAMDGTGRLAISTELVDEHLVKVAVSDTGAGIAPEHLSRIFDPFFTTKQNWRAPGLGLTNAFRIVEKHHGKIKVHSVVDEGTTMTITLPAARREGHLV